MFGAASVVCALAPSLFWLLIGRGCRASAQHCSCRTVVQFSVPASGVKGVVARSALGPPRAPCWARPGSSFGSWLIDNVGWHSIFLINLRIAVGTVVSAIAFVCDARREDKAVSLDLLVGLLATAAHGAVT
jgi:predicted MFS family arabinose efflux permease